MQMDYVVIIPAYNEELFLGRTLESLTRQEALPRQLIVVNDGSTDATPEIVRSYAEKYPWIKLVNNEKKEKRSAGAKVVRAFYLGYEAIDVDYDFLVKLDADLELPEQYFRRLSEMFRANPRLGIAGGMITTLKNGEWVYERFSDRDYVPGAFKSYRRECFEAIGGLRRSIGWDSVDELIARYNGWEIAVDESLQVHHHRVLGTETGSLRVRAKAGDAMYRMRYGLIITLISAAKAGYLNRPYGLTGIAVFWGWLRSWIRGEAFMVNEDEGRFIRKFRRERMLGKLGMGKKV
ncbi:MAG: glycosyltransferase family 2 protein [Phaeodactylibacter sp.]|nr:glycosyltransferase family 2 protein [Phaeodactylibacter sp.]MCB9053254.1 glycosyltransferase family 2 protein [Lewinellaceae bacterium]